MFAEVKEVNDILINLGPVRGGDSLGDDRTLSTSWSRWHKHTVARSGLEWLCRPIQVAELFLVPLVKSSIK
jgi:hypothetical protein